MVSFQPPVYSMYWDQVNTQHLTVVHHMVAWVGELPVMGLLAVDSREMCPMAICTTHWFMGVEVLDQEEGLVRNLWLSI